MNFRNIHYIYGVLGLHATPDSKKKSHQTRLRIGLQRPDRGVLIPDRGGMRLGSNGGWPHSWAFNVAWRAFDGLVSQQNAQTKCLSVKDKPDKSNLVVSYSEVKLP